MSKWREALTRAYGYLAARTKDPAALDAAYQEALRKPVAHRRADFHTPAFHMTPKVACAIMTAARRLEDASYQHRQKGSHGGVLGRAALDLLHAMLFRLAPVCKGVMVPSLARLATLARMSRPTVVEALKRLQALGFVTVHRRVKRVGTELGIRQVQDTNAYQIHLPASELTTPPAKETVYSKNRHSGAESAKPMPQPLTLKLSNRPKWQPSGVW